MFKDLNLLIIVFHEASSMIHVVSYYNYLIMSTVFLQREEGTPASA